MYVFCLINDLFPKGKKILFNSFPDISGNAVALYDYLLKYRKDLAGEYRLIWCVDGNIWRAKKFLSEITGVFRHKVVRKKSVSGIMAFLTARYIFSTHGFFGSIRTGRRQKHYNLWHGMPLKRIGNLLHERENNERKDRADFTISTSPVFQKIMAAAFGIDERNVLLCGQPYNDFLFNTDDALIKLSLLKQQYSKVIIWMPTYRKAFIGNIREDGKQDSFGVNQVLQEHYQELQENLERTGILLIIKPHPMDELCRSSFRGKTDNIRVFLNEDLEKKNVLLYQLLGESDALLTDYSSVFVDYLNLDRPVAFVFDDLNEYRNSRGFCFDPIEEYLPGVKISSFPELVDYLENIDDRNREYEGKRREINRLFNLFSDRENSKRVCDLIFHTR